MSDRIIPTYDADGNLAGLFDIDSAFEYQDRVHVAAVHAMGKERDDAISGILAAVRTNEKHGIQVIALVSAVVELADLLDASVSALDAYGYDSREKILSLYPLEAGEGE